ncbi:MAG: cytochrome c3 family protein [Nitrospirae bacterium]|nr:cytochrome c3 family protein [Nitrospirota bacterium]
MRIITIILAIAVSVAFIGSAMAVAPGKTLEFPGGDSGKVVFDGKTHADAGNKCKDCHPAIFPMKGPGKEGAATITMADINAGKFCGTCHNGEKAFKSSDATLCGKCHKK